MYQSFQPRPASLGLPPNANVGEWLDRLAGYPNFVAYADSRIAGHAVLCPEVGAGEVAVFVHQDHRGKGIGGELLRAVVDEARRMGLRRVWGTTQLDNTPMLRLARAIGFVSGRDPCTFHLDLQQPSSRTPE
jgi:GNAT superfamily N-acetyltransferase